MGLEGKNISSEYTREELEKIREEINSYANGEKELSELSQITIDFMQSGQDINLLIENLEIKNTSKVDRDYMSEDYNDKYIVKEVKKEENIKPVVEKNKEKNEEKSIEELKEQKANLEKEIKDLQEEMDRLDNTGQFTGKLTDKINKALERIDIINKELNS